MVAARFRGHCARANSASATTLITLSPTSPVHGTASCLVAGRGTTRDERLRGGRRTDMRAPRTPPLTADSSIAGRARFRRAARSPTRVGTEPPTTRHDRRRQRPGSQRVLCNNSVTFHPQTPSRHKRSRAARGSRRTNTAETQRPAPRLDTRRRTSGILDAIGARYVVVAGTHAQRMQQADGGGRCPARRPEVVAA